jgi:TRAP-type C4-dicarboxylate transport system substrate-binding protein
MDNAVQMGTLEALGAIPITVPYSDVYNALNMGVCDGWTAIYTGMNETSSCEVAPYVTEVPMFACVTGITISQKALDALSPESAEAVKEVYAEMMPKVLDSMYQEDMGYREVFEEEGLLKEVYTIEDTTPFIEAVAPVWESIAAENEGVQDQIDVINSVR